MISSASANNAAITLQKNSWRGCAKSSRRGEKQIRIILLIGSHSRTPRHDKTTRNFPAPGFEHRGQRRRCIDHGRGGRAGGQGTAKDREISRHAEGGATLRQLRSV